MVKETKEKTVTANDQKPQRMRVFGFRSWSKGTLKGFFSAESPGGLIIHDLTLHEKEAGARWIGLPSRKFQDKDGKEGYAPIVEFRDRATLDRFRDQVLEALDAERGQSTSQQKPAPAPAPGTTSTSSHPTGPRRHPTSAPSRVKEDDGGGPPW